ncbi:MAG: hypothetical protein ACJ8E3_06365 [Sphingomicrobium sp.]
MTWARARALAIFTTLLIAGAVAVAVIGREPAPLQPRQASQRPALLLLTSLPLVFPEQFSLRGAGSPALTALNTRYRVVPISAADPADLAKGRLLLMAHPQAQTSGNLVALDTWVRRGGRLLLLADPMLDWPSERPLGDPLRPSPMFPDTGLLGHWGLRLDAPDERGEVHRKLAGYDVVTLSPGALSGRCEIGADALVARCRIGKGRATIVGDADFLDAPRLGDGAERNLDALLAELAALEKA